MRWSAYMQGKLQHYWAHWPAQPEIARMQWYCVRAGQSAALLRTGFLRGIAEKSKVFTFLVTLNTGIWAIWAARTHRGK